MDLTINRYKVQKFKDQCFQRFKFFYDTSVGGGGGLRVGGLGELGQGEGGQVE